MDDVLAAPAHVRIRLGDALATGGDGGSRAVSPADRYVSAYAVLSREVRRQGLLDRRLGWYWRRMITTCVAFVGVWIAAVRLGDSWLQLVPAAVLAVVCAQFGFLGHDAAHRQIFASHVVNEWAARLMSGLGTGLSYGWWITKHNRHHAAPNQEGRDPDIAPGAIAFTPAAMASRRGLAAGFAKVQGWLFFPLLTLEGLNLHAAGIRTLADRSAPIKHRGIEAVLVGGRLTGYVVVVFVLMSPGKAAAFLALQAGLFGVLLGGAFAPNHKGMPIVPATMKLDFLSRQVLMSRNVRGGRLIDFAMGGLNYQIEHHLFPSMPRPHLRIARTLVRAHCAEHGLSYTETGLFTSYRIIVQYLNAVGLRARDPFQCPLVSRYRG